MLQISKAGKRVCCPCLYSTFSFLIHTTSDLKLNGDRIEKLNRAVSYNKNPDNRSQFFGNTKRIRKRIPIVRNRNEKSAQTSELSPVFLSRLNLILDGHHAAFFYRIVDFSLSGFGSINNDFLAFHFDSSVIAKKKILKTVNFNVSEDKYNFCKCYTNLKKRSSSISGITGQ